jgi:LacI family transcriptional regulator
MDLVNLKKLAEQLNLSVSTVSKAFRNSYDISPKTRDRVLALAKELNYQPNPYASGLRTQKSKTIAVILPEIANNFFTQVINGIEDVAQAKEYHVLIYLTHEDHEKEVAFIQHLQSGRVDGVLISVSDGTKDNSHLDHLQKKGIPIVFFDRVDENIAATKVITDNAESSYKATKHLIEKGCKNIALLFFARNLSVGNQRREGYLKAMRDHRLPIQEIPCNNDNAQDYETILKVLKRKNRPDGIFSAFEKLSMLAYEVCNSLKISIPKDIRVISFSNMETAALLNPSLSTITQPAFDIGKEAATILFNALAKNQTTISNKHIVIPSVIVKRGSTE